MQDLETSTGSSKPVQPTLPFKDLVQRGDPVPGIYKAGEGTEKQFRVFLPSNFIGSKLIVSNEEGIIDPNEPRLKVLVREKCLKKTDCVPITILTADGTISINKEAP
eukprot:CAMPEP_0168568130 /NCGR_PEP_ID=MMETSP0413-20121227/15399_1 /TAXON_ID=136452 /ORGANISM="Filamoeba nolandi, Strain NC-AS-23-1" /LENGTH=106 /DNA_ID=CAMNT_0008600417 /DNA_START=11 /DNA_END=327 /DNA_ORIENTATION=+